MKLKRQLGLPGAVMMGLGSMVGTGVFISIGLAAGLAGAWTIPAILLAGLLATCNGLSSAQLAASAPVSGGTYEYGYRYVTPLAGFSAGWMFLVAKSASAATAALGLSGYLLDFFSLELSMRVPALVLVVLVTALVAAGLKRANWANLLIVGITLITLVIFVCLMAPEVQLQQIQPEGTPVGLAGAAALLFVAYTGYGRIATLGEEVKDPRRVIPRAVITTMAVSMLLYVAVAVAGIGTIGAEMFHASTVRNAAPLAEAARLLNHTGLARLMAVGAVTAMLGVLLNLILGLSRVYLAMARRRDMPAGLAHINTAGHPLPAVVMSGLLVAVLVGIGDVKTTWSFSAFTVLVYYSLTNLAALRQPPEQRLYPRLVSWAGLIGCLFLASRVEAGAWQSGLAVLAAGVIWFALAKGRRKGAAEI